jgi:hypothetical protein
MVSLIIWYHNIKNNGFIGWLKGFTEPIVVMTPMNIIGEIAQPVSMAFRHFGNLAGGGVITSLIYTSLSLGSVAIINLVTASGWLPSVILIAVGACICGAFVTICLSYMFSRLPETLPISALNTGNSIVLIGCNLGSSTAPFVLQAIGLVNDSLNGGFITYAMAYAGLAVIVILKNIITNKKGAVA